MMRREAGLAQNRGEGLYATIWRRSPNKRDLGASAV